MDVLEYERLRLEIDGTLATLVFADPERLNALSGDMARDMQTALTEATKPRRGVRALTITGEGRGFCAGANLNPSPAAPGQPRPARGADLVESVFHPTLRRLRDLRIPVIAAVNGPCVGFAVSIPLLADYVIASPAAFFLVPFRNLASAPDSGLTWLLPRAIGLARARQMVMRAERVPAAQALEWGLVNEVVGEDAFAEAARAVAREFADGPTVALGEIRQLFHDSGAASLDAQMEAEVRAVRRTSRTADNAAAVKAFASKAPVVFTGA